MRSSGSLPDSQKAPLSPPLRGRSRGWGLRALYAGDDRGPDASRSAVSVQQHLSRESRRVVPGQKAASFPLTATAPVRRCHFIKESIGNIYDADFDNCLPSNSARTTHAVATSVMCIWTG